MRTLNSKEINMCAGGYFFMGFCAFVSGVKGGAEQFNQTLEACDGSAHDYLVTAVSLPVNTALGAIKGGMLGAVLGGMTDAYLSCSAPVGHSVTYHYAY